MLVLVVLNSVLKNAASFSFRVSIVNLVVGDRVLTTTGQIRAPRSPRTAFQADLEDFRAMTPLDRAQERSRLRRELAALEQADLEYEEELAGGEDEDEEEDEGEVEDDESENENENEGRHCAFCAIQ
ncbi:hypothetical protein PVAG01_01782 [Phlyctema vagabunda]|uniref:Uncharacterized protein n=1 Tax=Phlyctema vagabunda TaxID=108571 RepID=A0ABR4PYM5_9HELO